MRSSLALLLAVLLALLVALSCQSAMADVRRLEAVGAVPLKPGESATSATRNAAVEAALREAVVRVARSLLVDAVLDDPTEAPSFEVGDDGSDDGEPRDDDAPLEAILGKRMLDYTARYRILEDKGEGPALFAEDPEVTTEYVVIVEVNVEAEWVRERLVQAGLLAADASGDGTKLELEVRGLFQYGGYVAMRDLVIGAGGAKRAVPLEFTRGALVLEVVLPPGRVARNASLLSALADDAIQGDADAGSSDEPSALQHDESSLEAQQRVQELLERLIASGPPELEIRLLEVDFSRAVIGASWSPQGPELEEGSTEEWEYDSPEG